jgi:hypothetical protein
MEPGRSSTLARRDDPASSAFRILSEKLSTDKSSVDRAFAQRRDRAQRLHVADLERRSHAIRVRSFA